MSERKGVNFPWWEAVSGILTRLLALLAIGGFLGILGMFLAQTFPNAYSFGRLLVQAGLAAMVPFLAAASVYILAIIARVLVTGKVD